MQHGRKSKDSFSCHTKKIIPPSDSVRVQNKVARPLSFTDKAGGGFFIAMSKRFTETNKWADPWFRRLPPKFKAFWEYIRDNCDIAGFWKVDIDYACYHIGEQFEKDEVFQAINDGKKRLLEVGEFWQVVDFINFQYGSLSKECKPHKAVLGLLRRHNLKGLGNPYLRVKDKDKDKDKEKDKDKDKEKAFKDRGMGEGNIVRAIIDDLNLVCKSAYRYNTPETAKMVLLLLKRGFCLEDFKIVHKKKFDEWGLDPEWSKYLRPATLYQPKKFESYLNQNTKRPPANAKNILVSKEWLDKKEGMNQNG